MGQIAAMTESDAVTRGDLEGQLASLASDVAAFLRHHCGNREVGDDLAQDVMVRVLSAMPRLTQKCALRSWVSRIAINRFNDHLRSRRRRGSPDALAPDAPDLRPSDHTPLSRELDQVMRREIGRLPERQRSVLLLFGVREMDQAEIARCLEMTTGAVKASLYRARETLRERLGPYVDHDLQRRRSP